VLPGALQSALSQVDVSLEVLVVDDASTDRTAELVAGWPDSRVRLISHDASRGVAAARNRAASEATGEWMAFLDDDDLWCPTWLRTALEVARAAGAGAVYGARWVVDADRHVTDAWPATSAGDIAGTIAEFNAIGGPSGVVLRADVVAQAGGFDERLSALADWDLWLRVLEITHVVPVPELLVAYTVYADNMQARNPEGYLTEFEVFSRILASREGAIKEVDKVHFIRWLASEAGRAGRRRIAARLWARSALLDRRPDDAARALLALFRSDALEPVAAATPAWILALVGATP
jgi:glycosyltransferase involved in cell wall biosynthesis